MNPSKSAEIANLAGKFLKQGAPALASPITDLCNLSISLSPFPDDCKIAKLKQERSQNKTKKLEVHLFTSLISKVIEKLIHNQTQNFLDTNMILYLHQSGFRKHC